ncbi:MAG: PHP domain-containing protein [Spirochaetaceae bacterium]|jgi:predicted metal-dependent phosphoesterase TrpH|nr:PHP domain-containing protein [Spirochaetaceae bacterium]
MIDLHTHSSASDGSLSPARLVEQAARVGVGALALTDHDTLAGLEEAKNAAEALKIRFIPGVELEIQPEKPGRGPSAGAEPEDPQAGWGGILSMKGEFHLLGLGISRVTAEFHSTLDWLRGARERRNLIMIEKMKNAGIEADYGSVKAFAGGMLVARPHFALFLISKKVVKNQEQAFRRWLGKGRPFYAPREGLAFAEALRLIHQAGGAAVLAHPLSLYVSWGRLPDLFARLKDQGLDGIEAWHPNAGAGACKRLEELGRRLGLCITAGSDFHGSSRPDRKLGHTAGGRAIDDRFLEALEGVL